MDAVLMMTPRSAPAGRSTSAPPSSPPAGLSAAMAAAASRIMLKVPTRLMSRIWRKRARSCGLPLLSTIRAPQPTPAQLTSTRSGPSAVAWLTASRASLSLVTSAGTNVPRPSSASSFPPSRLVSTSTRFAPDAGNPVATAQPSPKAAPVASATDPSTRTATSVLLVHVAARRRPEWRVFPVPKRAARCLFRPRTRGQPLQPVRPPRPVVLGRPGQPLVRVAAGWRALPVVITALRGWVDERLDVTRLDHGQLFVASEHLGRCVGGPPRRDVVGGAGDVEAIAVHLREVDGRAQHGDRLLARHGIHEQLGAFQRELRAYRGGVVIPGEHVEGGSVLAEQPPADQVVEHQVIRPQPGEAGANAPAGNNLAVGRGFPQHVPRLPGIHHADDVRALVGQHRHNERRRAGGCVTGCRQIPEHERGGDP